MLYHKSNLLCDCLYLYTKKLQMQTDSQIVCSLKDKALSYHSCSLGCHGCLTGLLLTGFNFGLQVGRWVKILARLPGAPALDVVHANSDSVISGVNHWTVTGVSKAAICFPSCTSSSQKLAAHL